MSISRRLKMLSLAVAATLFGGHAAKADSLALGDTITHAYLDGSFLGTSTAPGLGGPNQNSSNQIALTYHVNGQSGTSVYYAGMISWDNALVKNSSGGTKSITAYTTFCTQLTTDVFIGQSYNYSVQALSSINDVNLIPAYTAGRTTGIEQVITNYESQLIGSPTIQVLDAIDAGAQAAIWKVLYDYNNNSGSLNSSTGNISWTTPTNNTTDWEYYANQDLTNVGVGSAQLMYGLQYQGSTPYQNQSIIAVPGIFGSPASTPAPRAFGGGALLLGMLSLLARLRRPSDIADRAVV